MHPDEPSPKLTVQEKLHDASDAAAAAEVERVASPTMKKAERAEASKEDTGKRAHRSPTRTRVGGRPRRRKSTLTAEELANLLGC